MKPFRFARPRTCAEAAQALVDLAPARLHAGGVDLLDRMKEGLEEPAVLVGLVDASGMDAIDIEPDGAIRIGARVTLAALAASDACRRLLPSLAAAVGQAASPQIRHRATLAGNLAQNTRCGYYRHASFPCLRRGGERCPVREEGGVQETAGILGNALCASAHPSSVAPVLGSLDAQILLRDAEGERRLAFADLWRAPAAGQAADTVLEAGDVIEAVRLPPRERRQHVGHAEIRQKAAFDWPLVSCAVRYETQGEAVSDVRVWFGSLAPAPWRSTAAEAALKGRPVTDEAAGKAAEAALAEATPLPGTAYKVVLAKVALKRALEAARRRT